MLCFNDAASLDGIRNLSSKSGSNAGQKKNKTANATFPFPVDDGSMPATDPSATRPATPAPKRRRIPGVRTMKAGALAVTLAGAALAAPTAAPRARLSLNDAMEITLRELAGRGMTNTHQPAAVYAAGDHLAEDAAYAVIVRPRPDAKAGEPRWKVLIQADGGIDFTRVDARGRRIA